MDWTGMNAHLLRPRFAVTSHVHQSIHHFSRCDFMTIFTITGGRSGLLCSIVLAAAQAGPTLRSMLVLAVYEVCSYRGSLINYFSLSRDARVEQIPTIYTTSQPLFVDAWAILGLNHHDIIAEYVALPRCLYPYEPESTSHAKQLDTYQAYQT